MNLSCGEDLQNSEDKNSGRRMRDMAIAGPDRALDRHPRVLANLLLLERSTLLHVDYFKHVQSHIQPYMREVVTTWMLEVCEEQHCEEQVFPLAVSYMDRYLAYQAIPHTQLQLLAVTALLLASKFRQCRPLSVDLLCEYTENSFTPDDLKTWEVMLLKFFNWKLSVATAFDFVEPILARLSWGRSNSLIRTHALTLASVCYIETDFLLLQPSVIAVACIVAAARGLRVSVDVHNLTAMVDTSSTIAELVVRHVERLVARQTQPQEPRAKYTHTVKHTGSLQQLPDTPTDVQDIQF